MDWACFISEIKDVSIIVGALSAACGINAWRREYVGKRKIDLAEEVLSGFYAACDAIQFIRSAHGAIAESTTRERGPHEREEVTKSLDKAYIVQERYEKRQEVFHNLLTLRYRFKARFGPQYGWDVAEKPFQDLNSVINEIFQAARLLGRYYWPHQERVEMEQGKLDEMEKQEAVFWCKDEKTDTIGPRIEEIVKQVESIVEQATGRQVPLFTRLYWGCRVMFGRALRRPTSP